MSIDGYAIIAIDKHKSFCIDHHVFDVRLQDLEFYELEDMLTPNDLEDCLVMVFFTYKSIRSGGWEYEEYEDCFIPVSHTVIQENYKEFWREQISIQVTSRGYEEFPSTNITENNAWHNEVIEDWETLYGEDFVIHPKWIKKKEDKCDDWDVF
jgi:hypothetical protein